MNVSFIHKCVFICTLSGLFKGHKNLEKSSLMLLYKGRTDGLVCVLAARGNVRSDSFTRKQNKEKQNYASYECPLGRENDILMISHISCLSVCLCCGRKFESSVGY